MDGYVRMWSYYHYLKSGIQINASRIDLHTKMTNYYPLTKFFYSSCYNACRITDLVWLIGGYLPCV